MISAINAEVSTMVCRTFLERVRPATVVFASTDYVFDCRNLIRVFPTQISLEMGVDREEEHEGM
jgi:hypothetical protein